MDKPTKVKFFKLPGASPKGSIVRVNFLLSNYDIDFSLLIRKGTIRNFQVASISIALIFAINI